MQESGARVARSEGEREVVKKERLGAKVERSAEGQIYTASDAPEDGGWSAFM